ncbi:hypothetical protein ONZ45_g331 [Pleurotus djamor]|nr:hypothetical protein ONZ45_g331 [Pleurotus djamor]
MGNKSILRFIYEQLCTVPPVATADLKGSVVLVVGANTGIGYEAAKHYAKMGAVKVVMGCRSKSRGEDAVRRLKEETGCDNVELRLIDLASFTSVKSFVDDFDKNYERLDLLVANAGVMTETYQETEDGWEQSLQVNHLAQALLILLLLPKVFKTVDLRPKGSLPRIVIVASEVHQNAVVPPKAYEATSLLECISSKETSLPYNASDKYHLAKLLNVCFTRELAAHLPSTPDTPINNCVNPGLCQSELVRGPVPFVFKILMKLLARTSEEGARQLVWASLAISTDSQLPKAGEEAIKGAYISAMAVEEPSEFVLSEKGTEFARLLWADTLKVLSKVDDRVQPIIEKYLRN